MKLTKSMIYKESAEAQELYLYAVNDSAIYNMCIPVINNIIKHIERNRYNAEKAIIAFYHIATEAAKKYNKDFGGSFTVTERWTAAQDMRDRYIEDYIA